jgi:hypothetical protein
MSSNLATVDIQACLNSEHCRCDTGILECFSTLSTDNKALVVSLAEVPHIAFRISTAGSDSGFTYGCCLRSFHFFLLDIFALLGYNQGGRGKAPGSPFGVFE